MKDLEKLFQRFAIGDRVVATLQIVDATTATTIAEGTRGYVERRRVHDCISLVSVAFDGAPHSIVTSVENLQAVPS